MAYKLARLLRYLDGFRRSSIAGNWLNVCVLTLKTAYFSIYLSSGAGCSSTIFTLMGALSSREDSVGLDNPGLESI